MTDHTIHRASARTSRLSLLLLAGLSFVLFGALVLSGEPAPAAAAPQQQSPTLPPSARSGQPIYQENCAPCHGQSGWGDGPTAAELPQGATALADPALARLVTPEQWFEIVKQGRMMQFMPPWQNRLSDEQIWDVVAYSLFLHTSEAELAQGETIWGQQCAACHGPDGAGAGPQAAADGLAMPNLADPAVTTGRSLADWYMVTNAGRNAMPAFGDALSQAELWAAMAYARSFSFQPIVAAPVPEGTGRLTGQVRNGTTGQPVAGAVILNTFENFTPLRSQQLKTGPDGAFAFERLPTGSSYVYLLTTAYGDSTFGSDIFSFPPGESDLNVPLTVYETSATPGEIRIELAQWFVDTHQGALLVGELYRISHDSDRVYAGSEEVAPGRNAVLRFSLPAEATSLVVDGGEIGGRFIRTAEGVVDTQPLLPGGAQILLRYLLPYSGSNAELAHSVNYPVSQLNVLVTEGPRVTTALQSLGQQTVADQLWNSFQGSNLSAGQRISLRLAGLERVQMPVVAPPGGSNAVLAFNPGLLFGLAAAALVAILAVFGAYLLLKPARQRAEVAPAIQPEAPAAGQDLAAERQRLLAAIAQLDDLYAAGELDDESYQAARAAQKRSLLVVAGARPELESHPGPRLAGSEDRQGTGPSGEEQAAQ
jgi:mono/diheme cytochrome c family protein